MSPHHFDDVDAVQQILDERRRNHRGSLAAQFAGRPQADNAKQSRGHGLQPATAPQDQMANSSSRRPAAR
jgi:hypothetical protein